MQPIGSVSDLSEHKGEEQVETLCDYVHQLDPHCKIPACAEYAVNQAAREGKPTQGALKAA